MNATRSKFKKFAACAAAGIALFAAQAGTVYEWNPTISSGNWSDAANWTTEAGAAVTSYPSTTDHMAQFVGVTATVNLDANITVGSMPSTKNPVYNHFVNSSDVLFAGGKTVTFKGSASWNIIKGAKIEASGAGTKVMFSGDGSKYVYGSNNRLRASDGGCIEIRGFKPGNGMWNLNNPPTDMTIEADGEDSKIVLRTDNNTDGLAGSGMTFSAKNGGEIQYGLGRSTAKYCKNADFLSANASVVLDDGSFVMGYTGFSMSGTDVTGQSVELKGANPLLSAATYVNIGDESKDVALKFVPEAGWANFDAAVIRSGTTALLGTNTILTIDGSAFGAVVGTKIIPLVYGATSLEIGEGVIDAATISGFASGVTATLVTNADDDTLAANTLYLKLVSNIRAIEVPTVEGVTYDGQPHTAVVATSDDYTITQLPTDVVNAGEYDVVLTLNDTATTAWSDDGTTTPKTLKYVIAKAENGWVTNPSIDPDSWVYGETAGEVNLGAAKSGTEVVVTYDDDLAEMPVTLGQHTAHFAVPESENYLALAAKDVTYTVTLRTNYWTVEPSVTPNNWAVGGTAGAVNAGTAASGIAPVVTYDDGLDEMPTSAGVHKAVFTVAEGNNYAGLVKEVAFIITPTAVAEDIGMATVTLSGYEGTETLTNFPVLVRFSAERFPGVNVDLLSEDGADVRVCDIDGNELAFEVENWDRGGESLIWVKVPELKPTSEGETSFLVLWGKTADRVTLPKDVWTEYAAVFHMNTTELTRADVTGNGYDVYGTGTLIDGPNGKAIAHKKDGLTMADFVCGESGIGSNYTMSCWYRYPEYNGTDKSVILQKGKWEPNGSWYTQCHGSYTTMGLIRDKSVVVGNITTKDVRYEWNYHAVKNSEGAMSANVNGGSWTSFGTLAADDNYVVIIGCTQVDELRIMKSAASDDWVRADYRSQTGELSSGAYIRNPVLGDVIVQYSTETEPFVNNDRALTIPYRVASTGGSAVDVHVLYAIEGDATTNDVVAATGKQAMTEDETVTVADLYPGTNYVFAIYGENTQGTKSEVSEWRTLFVPGAPVAILTRAMDRNGVTVSGRIDGANTKAAILKYKLNDGDWAQVALALAADGSFSQKIAWTSPADILNWQVVASNTITSAAWGTFKFSSESAIKTSLDTTTTTYTWVGGEVGDWFDYDNWTPKASDTVAGIPNSADYSKVEFPKNCEVTVNLQSATANAKAITLPASCLLTITNGTVGVSGGTASNPLFTANGSHVVLREGGKYLYGGSHANRILFGQKTFGSVLELAGNATFDGVISQQSWGESASGNRIYVHGTNNVVNGVIKSQAGALRVDVENGSLKCDNMNVWDGQLITSVSNATVSASAFGAQGTSIASRIFEIFVPTAGLATAPIEARMVSTLSTNTSVTVTFEDGFKGTVPLITGVKFADYDYNATNKFAVLPENLAERTRFFMDGNTLKAKVTGVGLILFVR